MAEILPSHAGASANPAGHGYWTVNKQGQISAHAGAPAWHAAMPIHHRAVVALVPDTSGNGGWLVTANGAVYAGGKAVEPKTGSESTDRIVISVAPAGPHRRYLTGYWELTSTGHVLSRGDAAHLGQPRSAGRRWVAIVTTADGRGYWVVGANCQVQGFGTARVFNTSPAVGVCVGLMPAAKGYWLITKMGQTIHEHP